MLAMIFGMRKRLMVAALLIIADTLRAQDHVPKSLKIEQRHQQVALQKRQLREREQCIANASLCRYPGTLSEVEERQRLEMSRLKARQQAESKRMSRRSRSKIRVSR